MAACIEQKLTLSGRIDRYQCELMQLTPGRGVLRYVIEREYPVSGIRLFPGDITFALYWPDRPYTLYTWQTRVHGTLYYFNIADSISLSPEMFIWRDLVIDILVADRSHPQVLDEEELPQDLSPRLGAYIRSATSLVLSSYQSVIQESQSVISGIPAPH
jgi:hypothetical protein